jgi:hypothetical protein
MKSKRIVVMLKNLPVAMSTFVLLAAFGTTSIAGNHVNTPGAGAADAGAENADRSTPAGSESVGSDASGGRSDAGAGNSAGAQPEATGLEIAESKVCAVGQAATGCTELEASD